VRLDVGGMAPGSLDAGTFRTAAGRLLGWQTVKSTLFDVRRSASGYIVTGRGSGHGVGLCVLGAMNRARDGAGRDEILGAYFPGLRLAIDAARPAQPAGGAPPAIAEILRVTLPETEREHLGEVRKLAARNLRDLATWLGRPEPRTLEIVFHPTVEAYGRATGLPWWTAGTSRGMRIDLLPRSVLASRGILESTLRHELVHALADPALAGRPLWVREGLAAYLAQEGRRVAGTPAGGAPAAVQPCPSDDALRSPGSAEAWRRAYDAAGACVARALQAGVRWQELR
jgi:hypothetical protein